MNHSEIVSFLWGVADLIRDAFKRGKYQDVILPLTVLRRLDCVLAHHKEKVLKRQAELRGKGLQDLAVGSGSSTSFQAQVAHFRLCPHSGHIAAAHCSANHLLAGDEARRIAADIAKLPELLPER